MLEWPEKLSQPDIVTFPASTSDIFPTLLDAAGVEPDQGIPLDGVSLLPYLQDPGRKFDRSIGFWDYPIYGIRTPSVEWMAELLEAQKKGDMVGDSARLRMNAIRIKPIPADSLPGHAAWLQWPWKLHRIQDPKGMVRWELYNLETDSMEQSNIKDDYPGQTALMREELEEWQYSILKSQNGGDY
jgi:arylsulfatase A-like enzyme